MPNWADDKQTVSVDGHEFEVKHLDKVMYPETGFTKAQILDYYMRISDVMLPHLKDRATTLKRYPHGVADMFFFEKNAPSYRPKWMKTVPVWSDSSERDVNYPVINDRASLIWLANQATIEFHVTMATRRSLERPRAVVFDFDPGPGMTSIDCAKVALTMQRRLEHDDLESWVKSSGSKGLHVYVPLNRPKMTFERTKDYAHRVANDLVDALPDLVVAKMAKKLRENRVFIDWSQNSTFKTTVCAYSLRAREEQTVSAPITWDEVREAIDAEDAKLLLHRTDDVLSRVSKDGDLFADVLSTEQTLPRR
jgi:bifunctional non-homologous end joining protein LigD